MSRTAKEMAEDPENPYKIVPAAFEYDPPAWSVLNPDDIEYGSYDREGAEWWAAHLYWEYLQSDRRAEQMLTGQEA